MSSLIKFFLHTFPSDITKACLIEGFQNQTYLQAADRVLKTLGKTRATEEYKVDP